MRQVRVKKLREHYDSAEGKPLEKRIKYNTIRAKSGQLKSIAINPYNRGFRAVKKIYQNGEL